MQVPATCVPPVPVLGGVPPIGGHLTEGRGHDLAVILYRSFCIFVGGGSKWLFPPARAGNPSPMPKWVPPLFPDKARRSLHPVRLRSCVTCATDQTRYLGIFARAVLHVRLKYSTQSSPLRGHHRDHRHLRDLQGSTLRSAQQDALQPPQGRLYRMSNMGGRPSTAGPKLNQLEFGRKRALRARIWAIIHMFGPGFGRGADFQRPNAIRRIGSGRQKSAPRPNSEP